MNKYIERAKKIIDMRTYNCAQTVVLTFAPDIGLTNEQAVKIACNFGSGMKMGSICGSITGTLIVFGMIGLSDSNIICKFYKYIRDHHKGYIDCKNLLRINSTTYNFNEIHCSNMIYEVVEFISQYF